NLSQFQDAFKCRKLRVALIDNDRSYRYVASSFGASIGSIHRAVRRFQEDDTFSQRPGSGRIRTTTARGNRFMILQVLMDWHTNKTAIQVQNSLCQFHQVNVSVWTIRTHLQESSLKCCRHVNIVSPNLALPVSILTGLLRLFISRTMSVMEENFILLEKAAGRMGLAINENKTKYMFASKTRTPIPERIVIQGYTFQSVSQFKYLGSIISQDNSISLERS
ncbi:hypothetical protein ANN_10540, partial [Periplaneta americana]